MPATPVTNEMIFETLKDVQDQISLLREDVSSAKIRLISVDIRLGLVHTGMAHLSERLDKLESSMQRVETRLNLTGERQ